MIPKPGFILFVMVLLFAQPSQGEGVSWNISPRLSDKSVTGLSLSLTFPGDDDGTTDLALPDEWGGEKQLYLGLGAVEASGARVIPGATPAQLRLAHSPGAQVTLTWQMPGTGPGPPASKQGRGNDYRPLFTPDYFYVIGHAALIRPEHLPPDTPATVDLSGFASAAIPVASDLEHPGLTLADLSRSALMGGAIRIIEAGANSRLALAGTLENISDSQWLETFQRLSQDQRDYWQSGGEAFLVTVYPVDKGPGAYSIGGTGLGDAFSVFVSPNMRLETALPLVAHEMTHSWIPARIGQLQEEAEPADYWLSEGFTNWATWRTLVRGGHWTPQDFAGAFNKSLAGYDTSPVRNAPAREAAEGFWARRDYQDLPYDKGMLIATWLDHEIRKRTNGARDLDDILAAMQTAAASAPDARATDLLVTALETEAGWDARARIEALALDGETVALPEDALAPCGTIETTEAMRWERGFDFDATAAAGWIIQGVTPGSRAHEAGLRNGMKLTSWSETSDDHQSPDEKTATVNLAGEPVSLTWLPAARETIPVRRLVLSADMQDDACARHLAGL
jgi:predicted metalloprotease with PDZ domain